MTVESTVAVAMSVSRAAVRDDARQDIPTQLYLSNSPTAPLGIGSAKPKGLSATATFNSVPLPSGADPVAGAESVTHEQRKWPEGVSAASTSNVLLPQTPGEETKRNASDTGAGGRSAYGLAPVRGGDLSPWGETPIAPPLGAKF